MNRFQAGIAGIWANLFASKDELDRLKQLFNQLGGESKGYLSREDIENGLEKLEKVLGNRGHGEDFDPAKGLVCNQHSPQEYQEMMRAIDADNCGQVTWDEFVTAAIDKAPLL